MLPLASKRTKKGDRSEFFPVKLIQKNVTQLEPIHSKGSGDITASLNSSGLALHDASKSELNKDEIVKFYSWENYGH